MENVILIGMPGVGKSTLGVLLAKALGYRFLDTDLALQAQEGCLLREIIAARGRDGFLDLENRLCLSLRPDRTVIATGGSVVYSPAAMAHLRSIGTVVYLKLSPKDLAQRLGDLNKRGVVLRPGQTLETLCQEREPLYQQYAHLTADCGGRDIEQSVALVLRQLTEETN
ncbi:MAG: shikimate kinase [Bacillota bacterium]|nr:shikimate kinase [Bacillota bacterium]